MRGRTGEIRNRKEERGWREESDSSQKRGIGLNGIGDSDHSDIGGSKM
jgi:hypothetical protein